MGTMASQITSLTVVYSTVYSGSDQKKTSKLPVTGLCVGNSPGTGEFPTQMAINGENVSIWWRHHEISTSETATEDPGSQTSTMHSTRTFIIQVNNNRSLLSVIPP